MKETKTLRDAQKRKLYNAQGAAGRAKSDKLTETEAQNFLDDELRPAFENAKARKTALTVSFHALCKDHIGEYDPVNNEIACDDRPEKGGNTKATVAHEYTHFLLRAVPVPAHGADFARLQLAVQGSYNESYAKELKEAYRTFKVVFDPEVQVRVARNQLLRLRSDIRLAHGPKTRARIPFKSFLIAGDASDFTGRTYETYAGTLPFKVNVDGTLFTIEDREVGVGQLRYVEAPMVRPR